MTVSLSLYAGVGYQFFDNNGVPLAGGKVFTYEAGTTTPLATYTTSSGVIAHTNPIILDSAGRIASGQMWVDLSKDYKFVLKTSTDVLIGTYDNVPSSSTADAANVYYTPSGTNTVTRPLDVKLDEFPSLNDFATVDDAIAHGGTLYVTAGTYTFNTDTDFANCSLIFHNGALFDVTNGVTVIIRNQVIAGGYQIFSTTGNIVVAGQVNPMWWGAVDTGTDPGPLVAAANTLAFRKAAKSFYTDYSEIIAEAISFSVEVPAGAFFLSNGFAAAVGVPVRGQGCNTLICRLSANADGDTAIPLLTIGQTLGPAPTLAYDPLTQGESSLKNAGFPYTAAQASHLYFVDQNSTVGAFKPAYPGAQFSDLFFTSCGIALDMSSAADVTGENIIADMGLTGILFGVTQNVVLNNVILYNQVAQAIVFNTNARDITINGFEIEYPQFMGIYFSEAQNNNDNIRFANGMFVSNIQYAGFLGMVHVRGGNCNIFFNNCSFRNVPDVAVNQTLIGGGVRLTFEDCTFDGLRTTSAYTQGNTMKAFSVLGGTFYFKGCEFKNLFAASTTASGACTMVFESCKYSDMQYSGAVFNFGGGSGTAEFMAIKGDNVSPLLTGNGLFSRVKSSWDWLGAPYADGSYLSWNVPAGLGNQYWVTVTARENSGVAVEARKSKTWIVERRADFIFPAPGNDILSSSTIYGSPQIDPALPEITANFVFLGGSATQSPMSYPNPTTWKVQVPNSYVDYKISVEFLD